MSIRNLDKLLEPKSIALIGATPKPGSVGSVLARNLFHAGFAGPILPVNPKYDAIEGVFAYRDVASLPAVPDLAVICTPPGRWFMVINVTVFGDSNCVPSSEPPFSSMRQKRM